jgi:hypothetical protein
MFPIDTQIYVSSKRSWEFPEPQIYPVAIVSTDCRSLSMMALWYKVQMHSGSWYSDRDGASDTQCNNNHTITNSWNNILFYLYIVFLQSTQDT